MLEHLPPDVTIYEVGPRDGLQNEARLIPTDDKVAFIDGLSQTGLRAIEITSFVNPKWIPQLADAVEVSRRITRRPGVVYSALVPNRQGLDAALTAGMKEIAVFMSASETHNKKNVNKTIAATLEAFRDTVPPALAAGLKVRAYVSTVYGCPYEGPVDPAKAVELCRELRALGCYQISLGDTIGVANPRQVRDVLTRVLAEVPAPDVAVHFHDTRGTALANILISVEMGITRSTRRWAAWAGVPMRPARRATSPPRTWFTCWRVWVCARESISTGWSRYRAWRPRWWATKCRPSTTGLRGRPRPLGRLLNRRHRRLMSVRS